VRLLCGMERGRLLPYRVFCYMYPRLGTPVYSVLLMGGLHLIGGLDLLWLTCGFKHEIARLNPETKILWSE
jgi:hypothetical protein